MRIQRQQKCPRVAACYARGGGVLAIEPRKVISSTLGQVWRRLVAPWLWQGVLIGRERVAPPLGRFPTAGIIGRAQCGHGIQRFAT
jgi:hypothetical protein